MTFFRILWWIRKPKEHLEQHLLVFCNIIYVFTDTCDQFNTLLLKKSINHIQKKILLTPNFKFNLQNSFKYSILKKTWNCIHFNEYIFLCSFSYTALEENKRPLPIFLTSSTIHVWLSYSSVWIQHMHASFCFMKYCLGDHLNQILFNEETRFNVVITILLQ